MIRQEIELTITGKEEKITLFLYYYNKEVIFFEEFLYRFLNSDADVCKLDALKTEETFLITKEFLKAKLISITTTEIDVEQ